MFLMYICIILKYTFQDFLYFSTVVTSLSDDDASTFKLLVTLQSSFNITVLEFSPFGQYLAVCGDDKCIMIWKVEDWTLLFERLVICNM